MERTDLAYPEFVRPMLQSVANEVGDPAFVGDLDVRSKNAPTPRGRALFSQIGAETFAFLRDYDRSLEFMRRAEAAQVFDIMWLERCPLFEPVRTMPGYDRIRDELEGRAAKIRDELL
jgi:hypothetical protein